jgi:hypothetical protein
LLRVHYLLKLPEFVFGRFERWFFFIRILLRELVSKGDDGEVIDVVFFILLVNSLLLSSFKLQLELL